MYIRRTCYAMLRCRLLARYCRYVTAIIKALFRSAQGRHIHRPQTKSPAESASTQQVLRLGLTQSQPSKLHVISAEKRKVLHKHLQSRLCYVITAVP